MGTCSDYSEFRQNPYLRRRIQSLYLDKESINQNQRMRKSRYKNSTIKSKSRPKNKSKIKPKEKYFEKISKQYDLKREQIIIIRIDQESKIAYWKTTNPMQVLKKKANKNLGIHPFFNDYYLSIYHFDKIGNIEFLEGRQMEFRGGWPYYPPKNCKRYGLKVNNFYGNNSWLQMNGAEGEWAVAYHGIVSPTAQHNETTVLQSIMSGIINGEMLKSGPNQAYKNSNCLNRPNQLVGQGIYCSPHFFDALQYTSNSSQFCSVLHCRVNPKAIKVCSNSVYWVINQSKDIRPYGVILIEKDKADNYPTAQQQFPNDYFTWQRYKDRVTK